MRNILETYPNYHAELENIRQNGLRMETLKQIIRRHAGTASKTRRLYARYQPLAYAVPLYNRAPRFESEAEAINNKVMNDCFSEIIET